MSFLTDAELDALLIGPNPPILHIDKGALSSAPPGAAPPQVQPCSVDLRINEIYLPGEQEKDPVTRADIYTLRVGESIRVDTIEEFRLPSDLGGLLFAPARITRQGVLVPDIGHVDPGFDGRLRLTLINVGRDGRQFRRGDVIATVLLFRLPIPVARQFEQSPGAQARYQGALSDINNLSRDYLLINDRINRIAKKAAVDALGNSGWTYAFVQFFLPILLGMAASWTWYQVKLADRLELVEARSTDARAIERIESRLGRIEEKVGVPNENAK